MKHRFRISHASEGNWFAAVAFLVACSGTGSPVVAPPAPVDDTDQAADSSPPDSESLPTGETGDPPTEGDTGPQALHGTPPPTPVPAPEFLAVSDDQEARGREDLLGHPTVMWFFPKTGTPG